MNIKEFSIKKERYSIPCKFFMPNAQVKKIIIGVHGFAGDKESSVLFALAERLVLNESGLLCFDFPAHGESEALDSALRVENCVQDLLDVVAYVRNEFPKKEYGVFATSFGGYITLLCSAELKDLKIVLRAPAVTMAESFIEKIIPISKDEFIEQKGALCGFERKMFVSSMFYEDLLRYPIEKSEDELLIIHGTEDDIIPYSAIKEYSANCTKIKLVTIYGADHRFKKAGEIDQIIENTMKWFQLSN